MIMKIDVYETQDLPEVDQTDLTLETNFESESIESIKINVEESLKKFQGKYLDAKSTDFSDILAIKKSGYGILEDPNVSLAKKIENVRCRIKHLAEEVAFYKKNLEEDEKAKGIFEDVSSLKEQFLNLNNANIIPMETVSPVDKTQLGLVAKLNNILEKSSNLKNKTSPTKEDSEVISYNVIQWPNQNSVDSKKLFILESSIKRCETVIGNSSKLNSLKKEAEINTIKELLSLVVAKATILDVNQLAKLEPRLAYMHQRSAQALTNKTDSDLADKVDKASAMHVKLSPCMPLVDKMKNILKNLQSLDGNHKTAFQFNETLTHIQERQSNILETVQDNMIQLKQTEEQMQDDAEIFNSSCAKLKLQLK